MKILCSFNTKIFIVQVFHFHFRVILCQLPLNTISSYSVLDTLLNTILQRGLGGRRRHAFRISRIPVFRLKLQDLTKLGVSPEAVASYEVMFHKKLLRYPP